MFKHEPKVEIQTQDRSGHWHTVRAVNNINGQYLLRQMEFVKHGYKNQRVRAVQDGTILDILP